MIKSSFLMLLYLLPVMPLHGQRRLKLADEIEHSQPDINKVKLEINLGNYYIHKEKRGKADLELAFSNLQQALALSLSIHEVSWQNKILALLFSYYCQTSSAKEAQKYKLLLIANYHRTKDPFNEASSWQDLGDSSSNSAFAQRCYEKAELIFKKSGHNLEEIGALKAVADNLLRAGKYDSAEVDLNIVLHRYQLAGYKKLYFTYDLLAIVNMLKGFPSMELFYRLATVKSMEETGDYQYAGMYYHTLAYNYSAIHNYKQALFYEKKALAYEKENPSIPINFIAFTLVNLKRPVEALAFLKKESKSHPASSKQDIAFLNLAYGKVFVALKQYQEAEKHYLQTIAAYQLKGNQSSKPSDAFDKLNYVMIYKTVINFYILTKDFKKAKYYLGKIPFDVNKNLSPQYLIEFNLIQFKIDSAYGNYLSAIHHFESYKKLNDSVFSAKNLTAVQELQIQYLTNDKKQSLRVLKSERNIQNMRLQRADLQRNITLCAVVLSLILAGLSYKGYRRKQLSSLLISKKNNQLHLLLQEKDWLLKEVHHRVKNNLHTVFCLLESQTQYLQGDALNAVESSQHRIYAMSLIHQRLYQAKDIQIIDMAVYLPELLMYLKESFGSPSHIVFQQEITPIKLGVSQAIPLALIINEAVTNTFKYAFPENQKGILRILLTLVQDRITVTIEDNGIGIPENTDFQNLNSMGIELMHGLSADLKGNIQISVGKGTKVVISFTLEPSGGKYRRG